jgi:hypothetical protein
MAIAQTEAKERCRYVAFLETIPAQADGPAYFPEIPYRCFARVVVQMNGDNRGVRGLLTVPLLAVAAANVARTGERRLTISETERLARAALPIERSLGVVLEPPPLPPRNGAMFNVVWTDSTSGTSCTQPVFVDIDTGEVWEPRDCEPISTQPLEEAQTVIRRELKIRSEDVLRARESARKNGCSNLIDRRPKPSDFHPAKLIKTEGDEKSTAYRYTFMSGGDGYVASSPVPIRI